MAKKKAAKKATKKVAMKSTAACKPGESCQYGGILALIIIALTWWKPAETWAQIVITVLATMFFLAGNNCCGKK